MHCIVLLSQMFSEIQSPEPSYDVNWSWFLRFLRVTSLASTIFCYSSRTDSDKNGHSLNLLFPFTKKVTTRIPLSMKHCCLLLSVSYLHSTNGTQMARISNSSRNFRVKKSSIPLGFEPTTLMSKKFFLIMRGGLRVIIFLIRSSN